MKLENIKVSAKLRESPAALFKVNKLTLSEDEKSIMISSLNDLNRDNSKQGNFDNCFGKFSQYSEVIKGMECPKYLKQLLHGYNCSILSFGVGESDVPGSRSQFLIENLECLQRIMNQNSYRFEYSMSFTIFGVSDGHCVNLLNYKKFNSLDIEAFFQDYEIMEPFENFEDVKQVISKGYSLPILVFVQLRTESKNELEGSAANISNLCLADLGSLSNPNMERSFANLKSLILTLDQTFVSGELRIKESPLTHLLAPFLGGNSHSLVLMEILTNSSFSAVCDAFLFADSIRRVKNRIEQVFENYLAEEVDDLWEQNCKLSKDKEAMEDELKELNSSLSRLLCDQNLIKGERDLLSVDNEAQKFILDYNLARMEVEKLQVKEKIRALRIEMIQIDHQRALKNNQAFNESIGRRRAEAELSRAIRIVRESESSFNGQLGSLRERIMQASDELQRSVEERSIMQSKLQHAQHRIDQLSSQLREVEGSRADLERQKSQDGRLERVKIELEAEIRAMRRQLDQARENEKHLNETVSKVEGRSDQSRREIMELESELRALRAENGLLQSKLAKSSGVSVANAKNPRAKPAPQQSLAAPNYTPINIPVINVPSNTNSGVPLEIADESPIVRRGKRLSNATEKAATVSKETSAEASDSDNLDISVTANSVVKSPIKKIKANENSQTSTNLNSLLDGVGKKKIKLPERGANKITITSSGSNAPGLLVPSTPSASQDIPRSTPKSIGAMADSTVMNSIMSSFTIPIPSIKK